MCRLIFAVGSVAVLFSLSFAGISIDSIASTCKENAQTTQAKIECLSNAMTLWDEELNRVYKEVRQVLQPAEREKLKSAQTRWIAFRDSEVVFIQNSYSKLKGTIYKIYLLENKVDITRNRVVQLKRYLEEMRETDGDL